MPEQRSFVVSGPEPPARLDHYLRERDLGLSRRQLMLLFEAGHVRVNGRLASKGTRVQPGDHIEVLGIPAETGPAADFEMPLCIIYEDSHLLAVDKPAGIPSHALRPGERGTVVSALLARYPELRGVGYRELESGLLHRLDNDTSGLLLAARDQPTFEQLRATHERDEFEKRYLALVRGKPAPGVLRGYLRADQRTVRVHSEPFQGGKPIEAELVSSEPYGDHSLVCIRVTRAARHQVRAQLAERGHPIAGDQQYGGASLPSLTRHFLHASELSFPYAGKRLQLTAALPPELTQVLEALR
ncbi:MAG TPA: pseudouridine synthase [Polyangiales bacterium]|nr:pseudouridine synthase [Polyangiales bacterium]